MVNVPAGINDNEPVTKSRSKFKKTFPDLPVEIYPLTLKPCFGRLALIRPPQTFINIHVQEDREVGYKASACEGVERLDVGFGHTADNSLIYAG